MVYGIAWCARHDIWYGLAVMAWYMVWPCRHHMVYGMAWRASHGIWLWPGRQGMGFGIVYSMAWRAWHGMCYGLACKEWCMVWPGAHGMIYGMAWWSWHDIWYDLFWDRYLDIYSYCVLSVDQAFMIANTCKYQM